MYLNVGQTCTHCQLCYKRGGEQGLDIYDVEWLYDTAYAGRSRGLRCNIKLDRLRCREGSKDHGNQDRSVLSSVIW
jgi:hypothetical protein